MTMTIILEWVFLWSKLNELVVLPNQNGGLNVPQKITLIHELPFYKIFEENGIKPSLRPKSTSEETIGFRLLS